MVCGGGKKHFVPLADGADYWDPAPPGRYRCASSKQPIGHEEEEHETEEPEEENAEEERAAETPTPQR